MKTKLFYAGAFALCVIALVACAAPTPTATPVPPTQPPAPTPTAAPNVSAILTATAPQPKSGTTTQERSGLEVGTKAPDFTLMDTTGKPVNLAEEVAKHKSVVLVFYRGEW